ncbi:MAG: DUF6282 family protein [Candidatus Pacebacteria bacterium]|jgi:hypothetical protein|nr:DUF6282 family protein [Candidatus Paceibacterota bacterium]
MNYKEILREAIDLHVHVGPEIIPRRFTIPELVKYETGKLKGIGVKNHFFPTIAMNQPRVSSGLPIIINSVALNNYVGGFNADIIRASAELSVTPIIVWFPTISSKSFLESQVTEIPKEWFDEKKLAKILLQKSKSITPLTILDKNGKIREDVKKVVETIKKYQAILATGHLSWQESRDLIKFAYKIGCRKFIITHPIYQKIAMPIEIQKELVRKGALIEQCYSMYSIDKVSIAEIAKQIKDVGAKSCILSSDVGQTFSPGPSEALTEFMKLLESEGITSEELKKMLVVNPAKLIG